MEDIKLYTSGQLASVLGVSVTSIERRVREYRRLYELGLKEEAKRVCPPPIYLGLGNTLRFSERHINEFLNGIDETEYL